MIEIIIAFTGFLLSLVLFARLRVLKAAKAPPEPCRISVIIPARNEEKNLPLLLEDLARQTYLPFEILVVDDCSTDGTAAAARAFDVRLISVTDKPDGWTGKSYACQLGAEAARGALLLFLDADVRLAPGAIAALANDYAQTGTAVSVQPYHQTGKAAHEQLSMFFNLVQIAANGLALPFENNHTGLYGPVILISKDTYQAAGGHAAVKASITEDLALGEALRRRGIPFALRHGGQIISFRMYGQGLKPLLEGWSKNFATGALKTPVLLLLAVFLWVSSCISAPYHLILLSFLPLRTYFWLYAALYLCWIAVLWRITRSVGSFSPISVLLYPIPLLFFICVFILSLLMKLFGFRATWKDRKIKL
jgi:4,4'-diaponeurosporenoate glycosyltransferase